jgi:ribonuclease PH
MRRLRVDGRDSSESRPLRVELGLLSSTDGSARLRSGRTSVLASVLGPRPTRSMRLEDPTRALLEVHVAPVSGGGIGSSPSRDAELAATLRAALSPLLLLRAAPRSVVTVSILIEADDGCVAPIAFNAAVLALADAGVPLRSLAAACGISLLQQSSPTETAVAVIDPSGEEVSRGFSRATMWAAFSAADITNGVSSTSSPLAFLSTGILSIQEIDQLITTTTIQVTKIIQFMRSALTECVMRDAVNCAPEVRAALGVT